MNVDVTLIVAKNWVAQDREVFVVIGVMFVQANSGMRRIEMSLEGGVLNLEMKIVISIDMVLGTMVMVIEGFVRILEVMEGIEEVLVIFREVEFRIGIPPFFVSDSLL